MRALPARQPGAAPPPVRHRAASPRPPRRRGPPVLTLLLVPLLAGALLVTAAGFLLTHRYAGNVARIPDPFGAIPGSARPDKPRGADTGKGLAFLIAGVDTRSEIPTTGAAEPTR